MTFFKVNVTDLTKLSRFGIKGVNAAAWLMNEGIEVPKAPNTWIRTASGVMVLRLGVTEFLLEDFLGGTTCAVLYQHIQKSVAGVFYVARADAAFSLSEEVGLDILSELCSLDLRPKSLAIDAVVMTQVAGISATVLRESFEGNSVYRVWCDETYSEFLQGVLQEVAQSLV